MKYALDNPQPLQSRICYSTINEISKNQPGQTDNRSNRPANVSQNWENFNQPNSTTYSTANETCETPQRQVNYSNSRATNSFQKSLKFPTVNATGQNYGLKVNQMTNHSHIFGNANQSQPAKQVTQEFNLKTALAEENLSNNGAIPKTISAPSVTVGHFQPTKCRIQIIRTVYPQNHPSQKSIHHSKTTTPQKLVPKSNKNSQKKTKLQEVPKKTAVGKGNKLVPVLRPKIKIKRLLQVIKVLQKNVTIPSETKKRHFYIGQDTFDEGKAIQISVDRGTDFTENKSKRNTVFNNPVDFVLCKVLGNEIKSKIFWIKLHLGGLLDKLLHPQYLSTLVDFGIESQWHIGLLFGSGSGDQSSNPGGGEIFIIFFFYFWLEFVLLFRSKYATYCVHIPDLRSWKLQTA